MTVPYLSTGLKETQKRVFANEIAKSQTRYGLNGPLVKCHDVFKMSAWGSYKGYYDLVGR